MPSLTILVIFAMQGEAQPLINALNLQQAGALVSGYPMQVYEGKLPSIANDAADKSKAAEIKLVVNGKDPKFASDRVGAQPAAVTAFAAMEKFNPDMVVSIGTVGAMKHLGAEVGDVYLADKAIFLDRRIPIGDFWDYGIGNYQTAGSKDLAANIGVKFANICTSNAVGLTETDEKIYHDYHCVINDMEAAAIADLTQIKRVPFYALKGVSNLLDAPTKSDGEDFLDNFERVTKNLKDKSLNLLKFLAVSF